jgi:hypothetical protein
MRVIVGNLWESKADLLVVTTNSTLIGSNQKLVMGRGAAFQAACRFPGLPAAAGREIQESAFGFIDGWPVYGFVEVLASKKDKRHMGLFQVKLNYHDPARLSLIGTSVACLLDWLSGHPKVTVAINYPGIGNGHLSRDMVEPILKELPDRVHVHVMSLPED